MPSDPNRPTLNGKKGPGRPTKRTDKIRAELLDVVGSGAPFTLACDSVGLGHQTFQDWRRADPGFDAEVHQAVARATINRLREIDRQGRDGSWQALSWLCERRHPESFGRPEVQLRQEFNSSTTTNNTLVITAEVAEALTERSRKIDAELDKGCAAFLARRSQAAGGTDQVAEIEATLMSSGDTAISLPPPISRHPHWWNSLSRGDGHRRVEPAAAEFIIRAICVDALGAHRASSMKLDMDSGPLTLANVWEAIAGLCGASGWAALTRRGEA